MGAAALRHRRRDRHAGWTRRVPNQPRDRGRLDLKADAAQRAARTLAAVIARHIRDRIPRADALLALVLLGLGALEVVLGDASFAGLVAAAVCTLPLALRRRLPLATAAGVLAAPLLGHLLDDGWEPTFALYGAAMIAEYSVAAYGSTATAIAGGLIALAGPAFAEARSPSGEGEIAVSAVLLAVPWIAGQFARRLRQEAEELAALAALLERQREAGARLAVAEERTRLARELHDAVAHTVGAMVIQGAAAEAVLPGAPEAARTSLRSVQTLGRDSVTELRRMLRILRAPGDASARAEPDLRARTRTRPRRPLRWSTSLDVALAVACFGVAEWAIATDEIYDHMVSPSVALVAAAALPLALRRRFPLAVLLVSSAAVALQQIHLGTTPMHATFSLPFLIALYTVGAHCPPWRAIAGTGAAAAMFAFAQTVAVWGEDQLGSTLYYAVLGGAFTLSGYAVRLHRRHAEELRTLTERLQREGDALARLAVVDERTRLARELHDTIAHGVSVMVLQAGAAEQVMSAAPGQARQAAHAVQEVGRSVLDELTRLLGILHTDEEDSPRAPQPGLAQLDALVRRVRKAGLPVSLRVDGQPVGLAPGLDASAYRVIQEALTNALKHAGRVPTEVTVSYEPSSLALEILSAGNGGGHAARRGGHGLVGMRERVELYGGELQTGPRPGGGYAVRAYLPIEGGGA
jgi:signal transduction histidine kinase